MRNLFLFVAGALVALAALAFITSVVEVGAVVDGAVGTVVLPARKGTAAGGSRRGRWFKNCRRLRQLASLLAGFGPQLLHKGLGWGRPYLRRVRPSLGQRVSYALAMTRSALQDAPRAVWVWFSTMPARWRAAKAARLAREERVKARAIRKARAQRDAARFAAWVAAGKPASVGNPHAYFLVPGAAGDERVVRNRATRGKGTVRPARRQPPAKGERCLRVVLNLGSSEPVGEVCGAGSGDRCLTKAPTVPTIWSGFAFRVPPVPGSPEWEESQAEHRRELCLRRLTPPRRERGPSPSEMRELQRRGLTEAALPMVRRWRRQRDAKARAAVARAKAARVQSSPMAAVPILGLMVEVGALELVGGFAWILLAWLGVWLVVSSLQRELSETRTSLSRLKQDLGGRDKEIAGLKDDLKVTCQKAHDRQKEVEKLQRELKTARMELEAVRAESATLAGEAYAEGRADEAEAKGILEGSWDEIPFCFTLPVLLTAAPFWAQWVGDTFIFSMDGTYGLLAIIAAVVLWANRKLLRQELRWISYTLMGVAVLTALYFIFGSEIAGYLLFAAIVPGLPNGGETATQEEPMVLTEKWKDVVPSIAGRRLTALALTVWLYLSHVSPRALELLGEGKPALAKVLGAAFKLRYAGENWRTELSVLNKNRKGSGSALGRHLARRMEKEPEFEAFIALNNMESLLLENAGMKRILISSDPRNSEGVYNSLIEYWVSPTVEGWDRYELEIKRALKSNKYTRQYGSAPTGTAVTLHEETHVLVAPELHDRADGGVLITLSYFRALQSRGGIRPACAKRVDGCFQDGKLKRGKVYPRFIYRLFQGIEVPGDGPVMMWETKGTNLKNIGLLRGQVKGMATIVPDSFLVIGGRQFDVLTTEIKTDFVPAEAGFHVQQGPIKVGYRSQGWKSVFTDTQSGFNLLGPKALFYAASGGVEHVLSRLGKADATKWFGKELEKHREEVQAGANPAYTERLELLEPAVKSVGIEKIPYLMMAYFQSLVTSDVDGSRFRAPMTDAAGRHLAYAAYVYMNPQSQVSFLNRQLAGKSTKAEGEMRIFVPPVVLPMGESRVVNVTRTPNSASEIVKTTLVGTNKSQLWWTFDGSVSAEAVKAFMGPLGGADQDDRFAFLVDERLNELVDEWTQEKEAKGVFAKGEEISSYLDNIKAPEPAVAAQTARELSEEAQEKLGEMAMSVGTAANVAMAAAAFIRGTLVIRKGNKVHTFESANKAERNAWLTLAGMPTESIIDASTAGKAIPQHDLSMKALRARAQDIWKLHRNDEWVGPRHLRRRVSTLFNLGKDPDAFSMLNYSDNKGKLTALFEQYNTALVQKVEEYLELQMPWISGQIAAYLIKNGEVEGSLQPVTEESREKLKELNALLKLDNLGSMQLDEEEEGKQFFSCPRNPNAAVEERQILHNVARSIVHALRGREYDVAMKEDPEAFYKKVLGSYLTGTIRAKMKWQGEIGLSPDNKITRIKDGEVFNGDIVPASECYYGTTHDGFRGPVDFMSRVIEEVHSMEWALFPVFSTRNGNKTKLSAPELKSIVAGKTINQLIAGVTVGNTTVKMMGVGDTFLKAYGDIVITKVWGSYPHKDRAYCGGVWVQIPSGPVEPVVEPVEENEEIVVEVAEVAQGGAYGLEQEPTCDGIWLYNDNDCSWERLGAVGLVEMLVSQFLKEGYSHDFQLFMIDRGVKQFLCDGMNPPTGRIQCHDETPKEELQVQEPELEPENLKIEVIEVPVASDPEQFSDQVSIGAWIREYLMDSGVHSVWTYVGPTIKDAEEALQCRGAYNHCFDLVWLNKNHNASDFILDDKVQVRHGDEDLLEEDTVFIADRIRINPSWKEEVIVEVDHRDQLDLDFSQPAKVVDNNQGELTVQNLKIEVIDHKDGPKLAWGAFIKQGHLCYRLLNPDGSKFSGTPRVENSTVLSVVERPSVVFNGSVFVKLKNGVFSFVTGKEVTHVKVLEAFKA